MSLRTSQVSRIAVNADAHADKKDNHGAMARETPRPVLKLKAQLLLGDAIAIGPGKADLLEAVARTGSIAAGGRSLGLSYRRTRDMIDTLNSCWPMPLVETVRGGRKGGGASLTSHGLLVLKQYRGLEKALRRAGERHGSELVGLAQPLDRGA